MSSVTARSTSETAVSASSAATPSGEAAVTVLDQALWRDLQGAENDSVFAAAWLGLTCRAIPGAIGGALLLSGADSGLKLSAVWPEGSGFSAALASAANAAAGAGRGVAQPPTDDATTKLALPIQMNGAVAGIAALEVTLPPGRDPRAAMRQLQWAAAWVRERLREAAARASTVSSARLEAAVDLLAATLEQPSAAAATRVAATELASRLDCDRVAIGFVRGGRVRVASISHSAAFGQHLKLVRAVEESMDEAVDQFALVLWPPPDDAVLVTAAHARLAAAGTGSVLTVPLLKQDRAIGAVTLERPAGRPFAAGDVALAEGVAAILGPALSDKRRADRWLVLRAFDSMRAGCRAALGAGHLGLKLALLCAVALVLAGVFVRGDYAVHAHARIAGTVQRAIVAPFDGFVRDAPVRAGDEVHEGELIAALDDRDLVLERLRWVTERQVHAAEYDQALSGGKRADAVRLQSQIEQADAQIRLADEQLAHTRLTAPFNGLVVSGDLSQSIGAPVRRGDTLFEVAPLHDYRVELKVPESQVADVKPGQLGELLVAALPDQALPLVLRRVTPVADPEDGQMMFRAEATLSGDAPSAEVRAALGRLRPGMEGTAKIEVGRDRIVWIWSRSFLHWLKLASWAWTG